MVVTEGITIQTKGFSDMIDITAEVSLAVRQSSLDHGTVTVFIPGSTAGVTTMEFEPGLVADFSALWERVAPRGATYHHDNRWGDGNGFAHVRASLLGCSLVIPFRDRQLLLGTWQQVVVVDFDNRPRQRRIVFQITGE